ncbi:MAG TPA: hypothetical protein VHE79_01950 [Spirochaetia bacterium]
MRVRQILVLLGIAAVLAAGLASCTIFGIYSISDRVAQFQTDLNSSNRSNAYLNFSPTMSDYNSLKDPSTTFDVTFPPVNGGTSYAFTVTDQSNSSGVIVEVTAGPSGFAGTYPQYIKLAMTADGLNNLISALYLPTSSGAATFGSATYH